MLIALIIVSVLLVLVVSVHRFTMRECCNLTNYALLLLLSDAFRNENKRSLEDYIKARTITGLGALCVDAGKTVDKVANHLGNKAAGDSKAADMVMSAIAGLRPDLDPLNEMETPYH